MRTRLAIGLTLFVAAAAPAQEFARATGGQIEAMVKGSAPVSGSLEVSSRGDYGATFGGNLLSDRLHFFGAASVMPELRLSDSANFRDLKLSANLNDRSYMSGAAGSSEFTTPNLTMPSSFLTMRYDVNLSSTVLFSASFLRQKRSF
jgi:hypothetical protein